ncbi:MAG: hypothetical protein M3R47_02370 [Chloroflexota bacterium]|nr:hypothetical protein [Chloroflexota bacterium]
MKPKNKDRLAWIQGRPLHTLVLATYPILALLEANLSEVSLSAAARPLAFSILAAVILLLICQWFVQDWKRAALISSVILILFYSYGHIYLLMKGINLNGFYLFRHRTLIPILTGAGLLVLWWLLRASNRVSLATSVLNASCLYLLFLSGYQLVSFVWQSQASGTAVDEAITALDLKVGSNPPDIYYIILDGYGRSDVLKSEYGYDNSGFLNKLEDLGFYVAECSQSNYAQTQLSLSSSLNFNYIDALSDRFVPGMDDRTGLDALIKHGVIQQSLEAAGYKTVAFATGFLLSEWYDADYYLAPQLDVGELNEFERLLLQTTFARVMQDFKSLGVEDTGSELFRRRTLFALEKLDKLAYIKEPKFVFAHLIVPHPPYVFGATGGTVAPEEVGSTRSENNVIRYRDQVEFISSRMQEILPSIIGNSERPPVILLQGDHGPTIPGSPSIRMKNLSAYYVPGSNIPLYPTITPVNSFRMIFNGYFGQSLPLLQDVSLYSNYDDPFSYKIIPNTCETNP